MILPLTYLNVADRSGVFKVMCLGLYKVNRRLGAKVGNIIIVSLKRIDSKRRRFKKGMLRLGLVVRERRFFKRFFCIFLSFGDNAIVLINKNKAPLSKRLKGPIIFELCILFKFIGTVAYNIL